MPSEDVASLAAVWCPHNESHNLCAECATKWGFTDPADDIEDIVLDTQRERAKGVIGRYPEPNERYVFDLDRPQYYPVHMIGVRRPLRVTWLLDGEIVHRKTLRPWLGVGMAKADTVIEERPQEVEDG